MDAALGEAAFLTRLVRSADLVVGASYAPLMVNVNDVSWPTNLIGYDAGTAMVTVVLGAQDVLRRACRQGHRLAAHPWRKRHVEVATRRPGHIPLFMVYDRRTPAADTVKRNGLGTRVRSGTSQ